MNDQVVPRVVVVGVLEIVEVRFGRDRPGRKVVNGALFRRRPACRATHTISRFRHTCRARPDGDGVARDGHEDLGFRVVDAQVAEDEGEKVKRGRRKARLHEHNEPELAHESTRASAFGLAELLTVSSALLSLTAAG